MNKKLHMTILGIASLIYFTAGCAQLPSKDSMVGTWIISGTEPHAYTLRIYDDGRVAQWPSPPDGGISWSRLNGNVLEWGGVYANPYLTFSGGSLVMTGAGGSKQILKRVHPDLMPGEEIN